jgi:hypothetical protein
LLIFYFCFRNCGTGQSDSTASSRAAVWEPHCTWDFCVLFSTGMLLQVERSNPEGNSP